MSWKFWLGTKNQDTLLNEQVLWEWPNRRIFCFCDQKQRVLFLLPSPFSRFKSKKKWLLFSLYWEKLLTKKKDNYFQWEISWLIGTHRGISGWRENRTSSIQVWSMNIKLQLSHITKRNKAWVSNTRRSRRILFAHYTMSITTSFFSSFLVANLLRENYAR